MKLDIPEHFNNRELSWLQFNKRVLDEAFDTRNPLMERFKFLGIFSSNLDEFYMVRVGGLKDEVLAGFNKPENKQQMTPKQQLRAIAAKTKELVDRQYEAFQAINQTLSDEGITFLKYDALTSEQTTYVKSFFREQVFPVLTPVAVDAYRPFPMLSSKSLNIATVLEAEDGTKRNLALVQVPAVLPRFVDLPVEDDETTAVILLEDVIIAFIDSLFKGYRVLSAMPFRITRNADLPFHEEGTHDLLKLIEKELKKRRWGVAIRLEVQKAAINTELLNMLRDVLDLQERDIFAVDGPIDLTFSFAFYSQIGIEYDHLIYQTIMPVDPPALDSSKNLFNQLLERDYLLHHPYHTFDPIVRFIVQAANDPNVLAIKQTLYRVSGDSPIIKALKTAAENGKQVTVLVELKARFDEAKNIEWAKQLEKVGAHVIYGYSDLKTHSKITLVVRLHEGKIQRFVHLGTGNYNDSTAKLYTDVGLLTAREEIAEDATNFFNWLSGYGEQPEWNVIQTSPNAMLEKFLSLIDEEIHHHKKHGNGRIVAKMNSLTEKDIILRLYKASRAGVQVELIVRGVCCLRPGIPDVSENIRVISIVDRYLEHSRIFYFHHNGQDLMYGSSADWMTRNMRKRIEILFPIMDEEHKEYLKDCLALALADNVKSREQAADGSYHYVKDGKQSCESQLLIQDYTSGKLKQKPIFTAPLTQKWITIEKKDDKVILDQNAT
ncbi:MULTISPECIES: RNA degradosome polyphosphate kinase [Exiguobacterium]|uniref:Polyphosphate kinase n=1 Tax=Exiguobacterium acetylicum TaxID=41170 RepID=A0ABX8GC21_EXIAC|nr:MULTISPECIES: RNA degradosome polyphosphate kinase [Exiguobacterium]QWB30944.1 RNA degradosome polyphosphate kinase [Exiguobacterium acetylicum]HCD60293.1 RNA degradosome polyphosphate kinase [Exiguobacterium sp.]